MGIPIYLAMTGAEFAQATVLPEHIAWMACHFSAYGTGLSNLPKTLPKGALIIVNDRTPFCGHDPDVISDQLLQLLQAFDPAGFLLDFQRTETKETIDVAEEVIRSLPCPVAVSAPFAQELSCPVFLPPPPLWQPLSDYLSPWQDREIWLEAATDAEMLTLTAEGCHRTSLNRQPTSIDTFTEDTVCCRYSVQLIDSAAVFHLHRDPVQLALLLEKAAALGVIRAVGLYQELGNTI